MKQLGLFDAAEAIFGSDDPSPTDRYYQVECHEAILRGLDQYRAVLAELATGLGKTHIFSMLARDFQGRILVLAHRDELITQALDKLETMTGERIGREQAEYQAFRNRLIVGSVQSVCKEKRIKRLQLTPPELIVVDECHHATARSYKRIFEAFPNAKIVGFTATAFRGDKKALGAVFEHKVYEMPIDRGVSEGWLVPVRGHREHVKQIDLSQISTVAGDLQQSALDHEIAKHVELICKKTIELYPNRRGPVFFPGKLSANYATERFNSLLPGSAVCLTDDTPPEERKRIKDRLFSGEVRYLCNVMVATEGFDWPQADLVVLGRPTKSRVVHTQMVGRGTRTWPGTIDAFPQKEHSAMRHALIATSRKPDCVVLDFVGNTGRHELVTTVDLMSGSFSEDEVKLAKVKDLEEPGQDPTKLLRQARNELRALAQQTRSTVETESELFDIFRALGVSRKTVGEYDIKYGFTPATFKQVAYLQDAGVEVDNRLSKNAASKAINALRKRRELGLATVKQLKRLADWGWTKKNIRMQTASELIDYAIRQERRGHEIDKRELETYLNARQEQHA